MLRYLEVRRYDTLGNRRYSMHAVPFSLSNLLPHNSISIPNSYQRADGCGQVTVPVPVPVLVSVRSPPGRDVRTDGLMKVRTPCSTYDRRCYCGIAVHFCQTSNLSLTSDAANGPLGLRLEYSNSKHRPRNIFPSSDGKATSFYANTPGRWLPVNLELR